MNKFDDIINSELSTPIKEPSLIKYAYIDDKLTQVFIFKNTFDCSEFRYIKDNLLTKGHTYDVNLYDTAEEAKNKKMELNNKNISDLEDLLGSVSKSKYNLGRKDVKRILLLRKEYIVAQKQMRGTSIYESITREGKGFIKTPMSFVPEGKVNPKFDNLPLGSIVKHSLFNDKKFKVNRNSRKRKKIIEGIKNEVRFFKIRYSEKEGVILEKFNVVCDLGKYYLTVRNISNSLDVVEKESLLDIFELKNKIMDDAVSMVNKNNNYQKETPTTYWVEIKKP